MASSTSGPAWFNKIIETVVPPVIRILPSGLVKRLTGSSKEAFLEALDEISREGPAPEVGEPAPDILLPTLASPEKLMGLGELKGGWVVYFFGAYTCPVFRGGAQALSALSRKTLDDVTWLYVYPKEAHPADGWRLKVNDDEGIVIPNHTTLAERSAAAHQCQEKFDFAATVLLDVMTDAANAAYGGASPVRVFLIDPESNIAYAAGKGPGGFDVPEVQAALKANGLLRGEV